MRLAHESIFFLSLWLVFTTLKQQGACLLQYFVKGFRLGKKLDCIRGYQTSSKSLVLLRCQQLTLCFCSLIHHILPEKSGLLQIFSYLFFKGKRLVDGNNNHFYEVNAKKIYTLFCYKIPVLAYLIHMHRYNFSSFCYVFSILNIVFIKVNKLYLNMEFLWLIVIKFLTSEYLLTKYVSTKISKNFQLSESKRHILFLFLCEFSVVLTQIIIFL